MNDIEQIEEEMKKEQKKVWECPKCYSKYNYCKVDGTNVCRKCGNQWRKG